jgi:RNA ligase (TIGR02306 family)
MRKLASIRVANNIFPIEGADAIEAVRVDGWVCVAKKGEFQIGDKGVYFEIDSFLPETDGRFAFLAKQFITFQGQKGARLRTIRLRGQISQGLFLPLSLFPELAQANVGDDVTDALAIEKWEPPIPAQLAGDVYGKFPSWLIQSDQERVQNLLLELEENKGQVFERTIKLDGTSMTVFRNTNATDKFGEVVGRTGVCSRNWDLKESEGNSLWRVARRDRLIEALDFLGRNLSLQGELIGEGIQGNPEKIKGLDFYVYNIQDIDNAVFLGPEERLEVIRVLNENGFAVKSVPVLDEIVLDHTVEELLEMADGASLNPAEKREGLVYKRKDGQFSFKTISNWYLEKHKDR